MSLQSYIDKFQHIKVNVAHGRASPHKICMLLAVLDLARSGQLQTNVIPFEPPLLERYSAYFSSIRAAGDHANPYFPFFHLRGALQGGKTSFWHLLARPGREEVLKSMSTVTSYRAISDNISHASLDSELFDLLKDERNIDALGQALAEKWFSRGLEELVAIAERGRQISHYERSIRGLSLGTSGVREEPRFVRDPAFRRVVTEIYDYRCAATGLRIVLPDGRAMVQAAHLHPFSKAADDDPRNGLALTPDIHWAMDRYLISPGPDYKWHVSRSRLDARIADHLALTRLDGQDLILPREQRMYPKKESLEWRLSMLD